MTLTLIALSLLACNTAPKDQASFQESIEASGITPPEFGFDAYPGGKFLWSSQSAPDIENPEQALGARGTDTARNWTWASSSLTMFPLLGSDGMATSFGATLPFDDTFLFTFAADSAVVGNPKGWGVGTEETENWDYVFYKSDECGRPIYDICLRVDGEGNPSRGDCDGMYVAPDCSQYNGYYDYGDTGE